MPARTLFLACLLALPLLGCPERERPPDEPSAPKQLLDRVEEHAGEAMRGAERRIERADEE